MIIKTAKPIDDAFIIKAINKKINENHRLQRLHNYFIGQQDILLRYYDDPTKPNNKITVNFCRKIADFLTSYLVGVAVEYEAPQIILDNLNYNDNDEVTQDIVLNMNVYGFGAELFYTDADGIARFASIDPREVIFVFDDSIEEVLTTFIRVYPKEDETEGYNVTVYTASDYTQYDLSLSVGELKAAGQAQPHYFNDVPAVFYPLNKELTGAFEGVIPLQDALNKLVSDSINDFESFVDAYMVLEGMGASQPEDLARMKQDRILLLDGEAKASWLIKDVNTAHITDLREHITNKIRELGAIPDIDNLGSFGSSGQAIKFKLINTEIQVSKQERVVKRGLQRGMELLYNIFRITDPSMGNYTDVKIKFGRNFIMLGDDKQAEAQFDYTLVSSGLLSPTTFLVKHKAMTPEEANEEIHRNVEWTMEKDQLPLISGE